jgi:hypothetical protein
MKPPGNNFVYCFNTEDLKKNTDFELTNSKTPLCPNENASNAMMSYMVVLIRNSAVTNAEIHITINSWVKRTTQSGESTGY